MKENLSQQPGMAAETDTNRVQNLIKTLLKVAFAVGLITWMIYEGALDFAAFKKVGSPALISLCAALVFGQVFLNNFRWLVLMRGLGFRSSVRETMPLTLIGLFFNFVMPGGVGGDVVKGYYLLQDHRDRKLAAVVSIFMDRIMGFFMMVATAFFALFLSWDKVNTIPQLKSIALGVTVFFLAFLFFFALSLSRRVGRADFFFNRVPGGEKIKKVYEALHTYRGSKRSLLVAATLSLLGQLLIVLLVYVVGQALGVDQVPLSMYFFLVPVGSVVQALPLSPAGIGVGQAAFYFLFNLYLGFESPIGPTAVTLMQVLSFGWGLFGAFFYLRRKKPNAVPIA